MLSLQVKKATEAAQKLCHCSNKCSKISVVKVGEGLFRIYGRNVFIRVSFPFFFVIKLGNILGKICKILDYFQLLKGQHMMVRVGGGWETLDHFLIRHDPCQVRNFSRENTPTPLKNNSKHASTGFLHITSKYRSTPTTPLSTR